MSTWFKKHPEFLSNECDKLESNSNYKEYARKRNNVLISVGEIIVRLENIIKSPIIIIYPESTPYSLPFVIPLKTLITEADVEELSLMSSIEAILKLNKEELVNFRNFWHQNSDGTICLLEADNLEKYGEFISIKDVINRVRDWLAGIESGNLPNDSSEVELYAHIRNKDYSKEFFISSSFLYAEQQQGECYFSRMTQVYTDIKSAEKNIYLAVILTGENEQGIRNDYAEFNNSLYFLPDGINSTLDLVKKSDILEKEIINGNLTESYWWGTNVQIKQPIQNIEHFAEQVGNGDIEVGYQRINKIASKSIWSLKNEIFISIRYPNRHNKPQWQIFILKKTDLIAYPIIGDRAINAFIEQITKNYKFQALRCSEFSAEKHHLRNMGRTDRNILKEKAVSVIGCGALGAEFADIIGKAGIGAMTLVDNQSLDLSNCIRHILGAESIGLAKVHGLSRHIKFHNLFVDVLPIISNITQSDINEYFINYGIGISTIANDNTEGYLNEQAIINNKIMFYGRALRGGKVARIFRVIPGKDACFNCLSLYLNEDNELFTKIPLDKNLPTITNECNNPIRPSSAADLKLISSLLSQIVLDYLQEKEQTENHWIWSKESIPNISEDKISAYTLKGSTIPPHPKCPYCQTPLKLNVEINSNVLEFMINETNKNSFLETGGILLGKIENNTLIINYASESGPKAIKKQSYFLKDIEYSQRYINQMYEQYQDIASYLGEWHYHPRGSNKPSNTDLCSLSNIANGVGYLTENPLMIIISDKGEASCTIHPARQSFYNVELKINNYEI